MSDVPADEGPQEPDQKRAPDEKNPREFLADALSPVVDPDIQADRPSAPEVS
jgi:hypothetical protein